MEEFRDIKGYEGLYQISNLGRVKSTRKGKEKILKFRDNGKGYNVSVLYNEGVKSNMKVHRLVAIHFIDNPENKPQVNHINGIKSDNRLENLEWMTNKENVIHSYALGLQKTKLTNKHVEFIRSETGMLQKDLALIFGVSKSMISSIKTNKRRKL
tara:strand:+ start:1046 stop:1510 length:465 start_codon:yes stop_codon:yes gene_type:complete